MRFRNGISRAVFGIVLTLIFPLLAACQADFTPYADHWRSLIPGQSTINEARKLMGKRPIEIVRAGNDNRPEIIEQQWVFKYPFKRVKLEFVAGTLISITLEKPTQAIAADDIPRIILAKFSAEISDGTSIQTTPANFPANGFVGEPNYPPAYFLTATTAKTIVVCSIANKPAETTTPDNRAIGYSQYPGLVSSITIALKGLTEAGRSISFGQR